MKINFPEVYNGWKTYKYKVFLVHIFPYLDWDLRRFTEIYGEWSSIFSTNTGKYGPENSVFWHYSCKLTPYFVLCQCIFPHIDLGAIFQKSQIFKKRLFFTILTKINLAGNYFTVSLTFIQRRIHNPAKYIR